MFNKFFKVLEKTRTKLSENIKSVLRGKTKLDDETIEELEEILISADVGIDTSLEILEKLKKRVSKIAEIKEDTISNALKEEVAQYFVAEETKVLSEKRKPTVILMVGVNGTGKTTSVAKVGNRLKAEGNKVMFAACDTFRAAAVEQISQWGNRIGVEVVQKEQDSDPSSVAYDAVVKAVSEKVDYLIIDTAGRLHNKVNLMQELEKIKRTIDKCLPGAPHEIWMVLDAVTGQNGLMQAKQFKDSVGLTGVIIAKLDGTAKGGIVLAVKEKLDISIKFIGTGETLDDIADFEPNEFAQALIG